MTSPTILVLDPHRELAEMAGEVLSARGFTVAVAERFETALAAIEDTASIRVAVCRATLPSEGTGIGSSILEELAIRRDIALVVITSRPFEEVPGIPDWAVHLAKPFGANELLNAIANAVAIGTDRPGWPRWQEWRPRLRAGFLERERTPSLNRQAGALHDAVRKRRLAHVRHVPTWSGFSDHR